jgi:hypothetical protein
MTTKPCPECNGQGQREFERVHRASASNPYGDIESYFADCDNCEGSGEIEVEEEDMIDMCDRDEYGDWLYERAKDRRMEEEMENSSD